MFDPNFGRVVPANVSLTVGDGWHRRRVGTSQEHLHQGLDIVLAQGTPILAVADGVVTVADPNGASDAGIFVAITHPSGLTSRYLHLSRVTVQRGQQVVKGQTIGASGNTGLSEAPHLHFDLFAAPALLPTIIATVGRPATGFGSTLSIGTAIPSEPWLPVDGYRPSVMMSAAAQGIPLFRDRPRQLAVPPPPARSGGKNFLIGFGVVGAVAGLGWLTLWVAKNLATRGAS
jgi:murein DD-endopeptidase MepM/ murein hydrolase activator NlpD